MTEYLIVIGEADQTLQCPRARSPWMLVAADSKEELSA
jgi:hypothetical protein